MALGEYSRLYNLRIWRDRLQPDQLISEPLCTYCKKVGKYIEATVVNHIIPHKGDMILFTDPDNLESVCKSCHDGTIQKAETKGYHSMIGADGWPMDVKHPINRKR